MSTITTSTLNPYTPGMVRALRREYTVSLCRVWLASLALAALALAALPWQGWCIPLVWVALVWWMVRAPETGYCE